jgi:PAS domain S-box-containing protein
MERLDRACLWSTQNVVAGKSFYEIFPASRTTRLPSVIDDAFQFGSSSVLNHSLNELLPLHGDGGQELLHNIIVRPISSGRANYCLLQINDVTIAVTRERLLRERQNARYHAIVDTAPDAIITTSCDGTIQWLNGAAEHAFGYEPAALLAKNIESLIERGNTLTDPFSKDAVREPASIQVVGRRKNGEDRRFDVFVFALGSRWPHLRDNDLARRNGPNGGARRPPEEQ